MGSYLWSSSSNSWGYIYDFYSTSDELSANSLYYDASAGLSVRCFKDSYLSFPANESGDGGSGSASTHVTLTLTA